MLIIRNEPTNASHMVDVFQIYERIKHLSWCGPKFFVDTINCVKFYFFKMHPQNGSI